MLFYFIFGRRHLPILASWGKRGRAAGQSQGVQVARPRHTCIYIVNDLVWSRLPVGKGVLAGWAAAEKCGGDLCRGPGLPSPAWTLTPRPSPPNNDDDNS